MRDPRCDAGAAAGGTLKFGDAVRLVRQASEGEPTVALCTAPVGCSTKAEAHLARELRRSGRVPDGFAAVTGAPLQEHSPSVGQRGTWEIYRADPLDGFPDSIVHYGQLVRFGQRPIGSDRSHGLLLSCEPPSEGGGSGSSYIVLGRPATFGYPDPRAEERKRFDAVFRLMPDHGPAAEAMHLEGNPVDLRRPVLLVPVSPFAYLHGPRYLRVASTLKDGAIAGVDPMDRTVLVDGGGRELLVEAAKMPLFASGVLPAAWHIEPLILPQEHVVACEQRRIQAHTGLPRALLGRALEKPPTNVRSSVPTSVAALETTFARWEHFRCALLPHLKARGGLAFAMFRKALAINRPVAITSVDLLHKAVQEPGAEAGPLPDEACLIPIEQVVAVLRNEYKIKVCDEDLPLLGRAFAFSGSADQWDEGEWGEVTALLDPLGGEGADLIDADLLADAVRGEPSPGRHRIFERIYTRLQREVGRGAGTALTVRCLEERLASALDPERPGMRIPELLPEELMNVLPLLRAHSGVPRYVFVRWMADVCFHIPTHSQLMARMREMWGPFPDLLSEAEARCWSYRTRPTSPTPPNLPPFVGKFEPVLAGWPYGLTAMPPDRGAGPQECRRRGG